MAHPGGVPEGSPPASDDDAGRFPVPRISPNQLLPSPSPPPPPPDLYPDASKLYTAFKSRIGFTMRVPFACE